MKLISNWHSDRKTKINTDVQHLHHLEKLPIMYLKHSTGEIMIVLLQSNTFDLLSKSSLSSNQGYNLMSSPYASVVFPMKTSD